MDIIDNPIIWANFFSRNSRHSPIFLNDMHRRTQQSFKSVTETNDMLQLRV